jgi:hypothetical protein
LPGVVIVHFTYKDAVEDGVIAVQPSPYTPGEVAREVFGRAVQLAEIDERLSYLVDLRRLVGRVRVDVAPRGLGKTSLLREMQRRAEARGVLTAWVTAGESAGLVPGVVEAIGRATRTWKADLRRGLTDRLDKVDLTVGVPGVAKVETSLRPNAGDPAGGRAFEDLVRDTVTAALKADHSGFVLFVDEIQAADADGLRTLAYAWQHLQSEGADVPAAVFGAGLPNAPDAIADVVTFSERFAYRPLDRLADEAAMVALAAPARALGVEWDADALEHAVAEAQGYPYYLQLLGDAAWTEAGRPDPGGRVALAHARGAEGRARSDLDALFRVRWERSTPAEQDLMRAMAGLLADGDGPVRRGDIARALGVSTEALSVPRARLLDKGLVGVAGHGTLEFTVPGFAEYVRRRAGDG